MNHNLSERCWFEKSTLLFFVLREHKNGILWKIVVLPHLVSRRLRRIINEGDTLGVCEPSAASIASAI